MFDTMRSIKSRPLVFLVMTAILISGLPLSFSGSARIKASDGSSRPSAPVTVSPIVQASPPAFDSLIQDDGSGDLLRFNSANGDYLFARCGDGYTLTGTGAITIHGSTISLTHNAPDRRVQAQLNNSTRTGTASVQVFSPGTTFNIIDRDTSNNPGSSDPTPPQVFVTAPNGGELVDTGSGFTITWDSSDNVAVSRHDVLLSTDGGSTFSPIVTGLAGDVKQYSWITPLIADNQSARVRVIAYDEACNSSRDASDGSFTLWNPGGPLPHVAEAPIYMVGGGFRSIIHVCSTAPSAIAVEVGLRNRYGTGLAKLPLRLTLNPGQPRAIDISGCLMLSDQDINMGSIRLRHNGAQDSSVRALVAVDQDGEDQSFTVPFIYTASSQSPASGMQCGPMFYIGQGTSAYLSLQNVTSSPVAVNVKLVYGTGTAGTPNGSYYLPRLTLAPQQTLITDLANFGDQLQGCEWGSIVVSAPAQTVAAHTVMMSHEQGFAFNSAFIDPLMCANTTKVASTLKLDYQMELKACVMVTNTSATETRAVTATFQADNGASIPARQVTLGPGQQSLIELDSRTILRPGRSFMADVRLTYAGDASDIIAGAVSMCAANSCAIPAQMMEARPGDGRRLVSPFFRFDERTSGIVQITNLGASDVKAGAMMKFADTSLPGLNTDLVTVPAGGTATVDLRNYFSLVDDSVEAQGCVEVLHNGQPGTITASFTAIGVHNNISLEVPLEPGPTFGGNEMALFPNNKELQRGDSTEVAVMTGGTISAPNWSVSSNVGKAGSITPLPSTDQSIYRASYVSPSDPNTVAVTVRADATSSGGPAQDGTITLESVKIDSFTTDFGGRLEPTGNTGFTIIGAKEWPEGPLSVKFKSTSGSLFSGSTSIVAVSRDANMPTKLTGIAPANTIFIGNCSPIVLQDDKKISKDKTGAAYYAFDKPSEISSVQAINAVGTPDGHNRLGGLINVNGRGFKTFRSINPTVEIEGLSFRIDSVSDTQIRGLVLRAPSSTRSCQVVGQLPCKRITVTNPGGREKTRSIPLYNLKPGPAPVPQSRFPDNGFSIGATNVTISGENLDFVDNVTIGGTNAPIVSQSPARLVVVTLPHTAGAGNAIILFDIDNSAPGGTAVPGGGFRYDLTQVTRIPGGGGVGDIYIVGPGEGVDVDPNTISNSSSINCISELTVRIRSIAPPANVQTGIQTFVVDGSYKNCGCREPGTKEGTVSFTLFNTAASNDNRLKRSVTRNVRVPSYGGIGSCDQTF